MRRMERRVNASREKERAREIGELRFKNEKEMNEKS